MKICLISNGYPPYIRGGGEIYVRDLAVGLKKRGNDVFNISIAPKEKEDYLVPDKKDGVNVYRLRSKTLITRYESEISDKPKVILWKLLTLIDFITIIKILKIINKENPDLIHLNAFSFFSPFLLLFLRKKIIYTLHSRNFKDENFSGFTNFIYNKIQTILFSKVNVVICPSRALLNEFIEEGFCKKAKGYRLQFWSKEKKMRLAKKNNFFNLLFIGNLNKNKGIKGVLNNFDNSLPKNILLHIAGSGPEEHLIKKYAKRDRRIFFYGWVSGKAKERLFAMSQVLLVPTVEYDNSPLVIYEAFSYGIPIIGSKVGGIPEIVKENDAGRVYKDEKELKKLIVLMYKNKTLYKRLSRNSKKAGKTLTLNLHLDKLEQIYKQCLNKNTTNTKKPSIILLGGAFKYSQEGKKKKN